MRSRREFSASFDRWLRWSSIWLPKPATNQSPIRAVRSREWWSDRCGYPPPPERQREYSLAPNLGYVEMWGGTATNYSDAARKILAPAQSKKWSEYFVPFSGTGGLTFADTNAVVGFHWSRSDAKITIGIFPVRPVRLAFDVKHGSRLFRQREIKLGKPRRFTFETSSGAAGAPVLEMRINRHDAFTVLRPADD